MDCILFRLDEKMDNGFICICCKRRTSYKESVISEKYLGLCKGCNDKISYFPDGTVFKGSDNLSSLFSVVEYKGVIGSAIRRYKFSGQQRYSKIFVEMMYEYFKGMGLEREYDLMTMVPLSRKRLLERGYCQTELLAKPLAEKLGIEFRNNCIFKNRNNKAQSTTRDLPERKINVKDVYIANAEKIKGKNIILVDDVYTTGSTMEECAKELKNKGAKNVLGITLAKAVRKEYK